MFIIQKNHPKKTLMILKHESKSECLSTKLGMGIYPNIGQSLNVCIQSERNMGSYLNMERNLNVCIQSEKRWAVT